jgi:hypothetical protein
MKILPGIEAIGKALWIEKEKILIIADLHIGYEEALIKRGFLIPKTFLSELKNEICVLLKLKPKLIIINGDFQHEFSKISRIDWDDSMQILNLLLKQAKVILIRGNHDTLIEQFTKKMDFEIRDFFIVKNIAILHGNKIINECLDKKITIFIIGHDHPAVTISDNVKQEKYKCFLLGKYHDKKVLVMPSFLLLPEGSDVRREKFLSPFLKDISNFEVFAIGDKIYNFGKVKDLN